MEIIRGSEFTHSHPHSIIKVNNDTKVVLDAPTPPTTGTIFVPFFSNKGRGNVLTHFTGSGKIRDAVSMFGDPNWGFDVNYANMIKHLQSGGDAVGIRLVTPEQKMSSLAITANITKDDTVTETVIGYILDADANNRIHFGTKPSTGATDIKVTVNPRNILFEHMSIPGDASVLEDLIDYEADIKGLSANVSLVKKDDTDYKEPIAFSVYKGHGNYGKHMQLKIKNTGSKESGHTYYNTELYDSNTSETISEYGGVIDKRSSKTRPISLETVLRKNRFEDYMISFNDVNLRDLGQKIIDDLLNPIKTQVLGMDINELDRTDVFLNPLTALIESLSINGLSILSLTAGSVTGIDWLDTLLTTNGLGTMNYIYNSDNISDDSLTTIDYFMDSGVYINKTPEELMIDVFQGSLGDDIYSLLLNPSNYIVDTGYTEPIKDAITGYLNERLDNFFLEGSPTIIETFDDLIDYSLTSGSENKRIFRFAENVEVYDALNDVTVRVPITVLIDNNILSFIGDINNQDDAVAGKTNGMLRDYVLGSIRPKIIRSQDKSKLADLRINYVTASRDGYFLDNQMADYRSEYTKMLELHNAIYISYLIPDIYKYIDSQRNYIHTSNSFTNLIESVNRLLNKKGHTGRFKSITYNVLYMNKYDEDTGAPTDILDVVAYGSNKKFRILLNFIK